MEPGQDEGVLGQMLANGTKYTILVYISTVLILLALIGSFEGRRWV